MKTLTLYEIGKRLEKVTKEKWTAQRVWWVTKGKKHVSFREALLIQTASEGQYKASALCTDYKAIARQMKKAL